MSTHIVITLSKYTKDTLPHPTFVERHVCTTCSNTKEAAEEFAERAHAARRGRTLTDKNTVFIAPNMDYLTDEPSKKIVFKRRAPKYVCRPSRGPVKKKWSCESAGISRPFHDPVTGHYYFDEDIDCIDRKKS